MAGRGDHLDAKRAERDHVAVLQQPVEVAAFRLQVVRSELPPERYLHIANPRPDRHHSARPAFQMIRRRQVVGMGMGLQHPSDRNARGLGGSQHPVGSFTIHSATDRIEAEHGIDDRPGAARRIGHEVADAVGRFVEEGLDRRGARVARSLIVRAWLYRFGGHASVRA